MDKKEILDFLKNNKTFLKEQYNVSKIGLFGSYATGNEKENSDIDILVEMPSSFDKYYDLKDFLESHLNVKIDLGLKNNIRELLKKEIENEVIYV